MGHTIFCRAEQGIIEIIVTYEWSSSYFNFWCIWNKIFSPANKWDLFKNYFLEKLLLTGVLSDLENFVTFSRKPDRLSPFLLMYWSCSLHFYLRKGDFHRKSQKWPFGSFLLNVAVLKHFTNFREIIRGGVFLLPKN